MINSLFLFLHQIRYWKKNQKNTTLHEELIVVPENRNRRATFDNNDNRSNEKIRGKVSNLPSFSEIEADVVVANSFFTSQGSNIISFTTPEGGNINIWNNLHFCMHTFYTVVNPPVQHCHYKHPFPLFYATSNRHVLYI